MFEMLHSMLEWTVELTESDYNLSLKELVESGERITKSAFLRTTQQLQRMS